MTGRTLAYQKEITRKRSDYPLFSSCGKLALDEQCPYQVLVRRCSGSAVPGVCGSPIAVIKSHRVAQAAVTWRCLLCCVVLGCRGKEMV